MRHVRSGIRSGIVIGAALMVAACGPTTQLGTSRSYQQNFLSDYTRLQPRGSSDFIYVSPEATLMMATAKGVMIDQPEIHIAEGSDYKGAKPADLAIIAEAMRGDLSEALRVSGYNIATEPGVDILLLRTALTDVYLEKKERGVLGYTPIGFVVGAGVSAMEGVMEKVDIMGMTLQAELVNSKSGTLGFELVAQRGGNEQRITFDQFQGQMKTWGQRLRCQIDNSKLPVPQRQDCTKIGSTG
jgi:hypothetical protein